MSLRIATLNVNGIRSASRRGLLDWLSTRECDLVALQEVRCPPEQIPRLPGKLTYDAGTFAGRNGVALLSTTAPSAVRGFGGRRFDHEGRYLEADFELRGRALTVVSLYVPKGGRANEPEFERRHAHKRRFLASLRVRLDRARLLAVRAGREFLVLGDLNIAHTPLDLTNARSNRNQVGFLDSERAWLGGLLGPRRLVDVVRRLRPDEQGPYSWWPWNAANLAADVGWRIDYQLATPALARSAVTAGTDRPISYEQRLSDHAPVVVDYA